MLRDWKKVSKDEWYVASARNVPTEPRFMRVYYKRELERIGINPILKFHALRHTFATTLIAAKVDVKTVSALLGHSDISTTMNTYVHPSEDAKRSAVSYAFRKIL